MLATNPWTGCVNYGALACVFSSGGIYEIRARSRADCSPEGNEQSYTHMHAHAQHHAPTYIIWLADLWRHHSDSFIDAAAAAVAALSQLIFIFHPLRARS